MIKTGNSNNYFTLAMCKCNAVYFEINDISALSESEKAKMKTIGGGAYNPMSFFKLHERFVIYI